MIPNSVDIVAMVAIGKVAGLSAVDHKDDAGRHCGQVAIIGPLVDLACAVGCTTHQLHRSAWPAAASVVAAAVPHPSGDAARTHGSLVEHAQLILVDHRFIDLQVGDRLGREAAGDVLRVGVAVLLMSVVCKLGGNIAVATVKIRTVFAHFARTVQYIDTQVAFAAERWCGQSAIGHHLHIAGDAIAVCAIQHMGECRVAVQCHQGV